MNLVAVELNRPEFRFLDLLFPWIMLIGLLGFLAAWFLVAIMERTGLSRYVWHFFKRSGSSCYPGSGSDVDEFYFWGFAGAVIVSTFQSIGLFGIVLLLFLLTLVEMKKKSPV
jgi:Protein of unknown function (DUF1656)